MRKYLVLIVALMILGGMYVYIYLPPRAFPSGSIVSIPAGESLDDITNTLYEKHVIAWPIVFRSTVILLGGEYRMIAGDYLLARPQGPADLAYRFIHGE